MHSEYELKAKEAGQVEVSDICVLCRKNKKDFSSSPYAEHCSDCRQQFLDYPIPKWID